MSQLSELIRKYESNQGYYRSSSYNETQLRVDFLDPLFKLFGWDITNQQNKSTNEREVLVEEGLKHSKNANINKPDYTFRLFSERKFFLEAKKPSIDILVDLEPAKQIRRYGFTARLKISVLSNFEYRAIYDTSGVVTDQDKASDYRLCLYHFKEFEEKFDEINRLLGRESVYSGSFDEVWLQIEEKIQRFSVDDLFLQQINKWRLNLSEQLLLSDSHIDESKLNDLTQSYINSLFFLRVCEDRNLETYQTLLSSSQKRDTASLVKILKDADRKYNSGLFDLEFIDNFLDDPESYIWNIIDELYYPKSPYSFAVFSSDILGNIYEIFLSEKISINNGRAALRPKEDNLDRDIVTTPTFIIGDILRKTLVQYCCGKTDKEILSSRFADIACGSGAFLLEAFQYLQDILVDYYLENDKTKLQQISLNAYKLNYEIKKELLISCIFGVDKDFNAVKACQFGLLLKLLEGESNSTITSPVLPILDKNIFYGNSLIDYKQCSEKDIYSINPLNLNGLNFDIIFGNPPYLSTEDIKKLTPL
ncbi:MAG: adenine methyltransferase, partial [Legionella longbeachae]|nr:adenine methyltransferase [Legionella longbeachae]